MKNLSLSILFGLKIVLSSLLLIFYWSYLSNRDILCFSNGKCVTLKGAYVVPGIFLGVSIPLEAVITYRSSSIDELSIYNSNKPECDFFIEAGNIVKKSPNRRVCYVDQSLIEKEIKDKNIDPLDFDTKFKIKTEQIQRQTLWNEVYTKIDDHGVIGWTTQIIYDKKDGMHKIVRAEYELLRYFVAIILMVVISLRLLTAKPILSNKPKTEQLQILASWGLVTIIESVVIAIIDIVLVVGILALVSWLKI